MIRKALLAFGAVVALFVGFQLLTFPRVGDLRNENPSTTAFMEQRQAELRASGKNDQLEQNWVPYQQISPHLRSAVIVSEDSRFFNHEGVDTVELEKILRKAWETKKIERGGSTITQQLAKNLYLSPSRNPWRKIKEIIIAKRMEQSLEKKRILELYLNLVEFGERIYGAEAAARHYFGKPASALSPSEAALLAGALPNPREMNPGNPGPYLRSRRDIIVSRMKRWGYMAERTLVETPAAEETDRKNSEESHESQEAAPERSDDPIEGDLPVLDPGSYGDKSETEPAPSEANPEETPEGSSADPLPNDEILA
ncbi:MAG: monofunctional biosynthetic peptidoglycan transglycosylase [Thermoanaerobaculia bacterium]|nr:monofunctional biosynthetic peptidoglycan transglycosylase [Thermoanaerobaculia bacterium]